MECNRDEALRAKSIAEGKLENKDFVGAKKFALKARALYPDLDGISQMLTTLDVYLAGETKIRGEVDWYAVLRVSPSADDETVRKQYRKLALMLHPDKNSSPGADGAFKLISEAWNLLSDKTKRLRYNQRIGNARFQRTNDVVYQNFTNRMRTAPDFGNNGVKVPQKSAPPVSSSERTDTFWTTCHGCHYCFEYEKKYLNCTLRCVICKVPFLASETMCYAPGSNIQGGSVSGSNFQGGSVSVKLAKKRKMAK